MDWNEIIPDEHGDWLNQRDDSFHKFIRLDGKRQKKQPYLRISH